jgi:hypothetical protein
MGGKHVTNRNHRRITARRKEGVDQVSANVWVLQCRISDNCGFSNVYYQTKRVSISSSNNLWWPSGDKVADAPTDGILSSQVVDHLARRRSQV